MATRFAALLLHHRHRPLNHFPAVLTADKGGLSPFPLHQTWIHSVSSASGRRDRPERPSLHQIRNYSDSNESSPSLTTGAADVTGKEEEDITWVHPTGSSTERLNIASRLCIMNGTVCLTLNSSLPISASLVNEALDCLQRKSQTLRVCLKHREGKLWYCENTQPKMNFRVVSGVEWREEMHKMMYTPYNSADGSVWRATFVQNAMNAPNPLLDLTKEFPHQCHVILGFHHGVFDGVNCLTVIENFFKILDDVISGIPVDDRQFGKLVSNEYIETIEEEMKNELKKMDPQELDVLTKEILNVDFKCLLNEAFGIPKVSDPLTKRVYSMMNWSTMEKFEAKCQSLGITVNSGLCAVINTALVEVVKDAGLERESYSITTRMAVDMRRYRTDIDNPQKIQGFHMIPLSHTADTPHDIRRKNFWEYAKKLNADLRWKLMSKYTVQEKVIRDINHPQDFSYEAFYSSQPPIVYDYFLTNLNSPKFADFGSGNNVQISDMIVLENIHNVEFNHFHLVTRQRDRLLYTINYYTGTVSEEGIKKLHKKVLELLDELSES